MMSGFVSRSVEAVRTRVLRVGRVAMFARTFRGSPGETHLGATTPGPCGSAVLGFALLLACLLLAAMVRPTRRARAGRA